MTERTSPQISLTLNISPRISLTQILAHGFINSNISPRISLTQTLGPRTARTIIFVPHPQLQCSSVSPLNSKPRAAPRIPKQKGDQHHQLTHVTRRSKEEGEIEEQSRMLMIARRYREQRAEAEAAAHQEEEEAEAGAVETPQASDRPPWH